MPPNSLRLQLLGWLLGPLAVVVAVNTWAIYTNATETATVVQDRMLLGAVRIIAEQTYYKDGELHVEVPPAALELFESSSQDRVFYTVASPRGALLLGYAELPAPRDPSAALADAMNDYVRRLDAHVSAQGRFITYASHQLRTALTVLNTQVSFALRTADPAARDDALRAIRDGVRHGIRLVNQLLLLFTAEAGAAPPLRQAEVDLAEVAQRVLEELAALAQSRNIDLGFERKGDAATVRGTPSMLHEMVANLVDNAIRYTPPGGAVTAAILGSASGVTLRVEDNGPGIPADQRERVFERFYRLHDDRPGGSGLGLPIVREIAAASRADVKLSDRPSGNGLIVSVTFS